MKMTLKQWLIIVVVTLIIGGIVICLGLNCGIKKGKIVENQQKSYNSIRK